MLSLTLAKRRCTYRPSVIYLIVNKLLSLALSLSRARSLSLSLSLSRSLALSVSASNHTGFIYITSPGIDLPPSPPSRQRRGRSPKASASTLLETFLRLLRHRPSSVSSFADKSFRLHPNLSLYPPQFLYCLEHIPLHTLS